MYTVDAFPDGILSSNERRLTYLFRLFEYSIGGGGGGEEVASLMDSLSKKRFFNSRIKLSYRCKCNALCIRLRVLRESFYKI